MTENEKRDYQKYYKKDATGFSPERNRDIIEQTIKEYEATRAAKKKKQYEGLDERASAAASFLMHLEKHGDPYGDAALKYFGKKELARLQGQKILKTFLGNRVLLSESDEIF